jgi:CxxC motif-containing protein
MEKELICITCPMGCQLKAVIENGEVISVTGNTCPRGAEYAKTELINPQRVITTTVRTKEGSIVSVKTDKAVDKSKMFECMSIINKLHPSVDECDVGSIICENIMGSGANIVVTQPAHRK